VGPPFGMGLSRLFFAYGEVDPGLLGVSPARPSGFNLLPSARVLPLMGRPPRLK
jgi:hypothetical protein